MMKQQTLIPDQTLEMIFEIVQIKQIRTANTEGIFVKQILSPLDAAEIAMKLIGDEDREVFLVMCLNTKNEVNAIHRCHVGSINAALVHPREVFKSAILNNSAGIIVAHNHPSNVCSPSPEDIDVSKRLQEAGEILGIELLDSMIVGDRVFISLKEKGYL